jgi:hypothetical protein
LVEIRARDSVTGAPITWTAETCHWQVRR